MTWIFLKERVDTHRSYDSWWLVNLQDCLFTLLSLEQSILMPCHTSNAFLQTALQVFGHSLHWSFLLGWKADSTAREQWDCVYICVLITTALAGKTDSQVRQGKGLMSQSPEPSVANPESRTDGLLNQALRLSSSKRKGSPVHRLCEREEKKHSEIIVYAGRFPKHMKSGIYLEEMFQQ